VKPDQKPGEKPSADDWRSLVEGVAVGRVIGPFVMLMAATYIGIAAFVLVMVWQGGPQRLIDAERAAAFTARKDARIVESWLALELNPGDMGQSKYWRAFAKATPCAIVEYDGEWGTAHRAFCGNRRTFFEYYTVHDLRLMAPGVAFEFARDANGFSVPEIRMDKAALAWLAAQPAMNPFRKYSALEEMGRRLDRPVEVAILSWSTRPPAFPLALDPKRPAEAMPAGYTEWRHGRSTEHWYPLILASVVGLAFWFKGMFILLGNLVPAGRVILGSLPLITLPWWQAELPSALRHLNAEVASELAYAMGDIDIASGLTASDPAEAVQRDGERIIFGIDRGPYADTMGRIRFVLPSPAPTSADAALAALAANVATQVRKLDRAGRIELFDRLKSDKKDELAGAGLIFVPAAKEAMTDPKVGEEIQRAAAGFLSEFVTQPVQEPKPREPAYKERLRLLRELLDVPVPEIATRAAWIVESAQSAEKK
jgi:hypothetical protein